MTSLVITAFAFPTPLGRLILSLETAAGAAPRVSGPIPAPAAAVWRLGPGRAALTLVPYAPELPEPLAVSSATALILRIGGDHATAPVTLRLELETRAASGGAASGQFLEAFTWIDEGTELSLGTQDNEHLAHRAERGLGVPRRLAEPWRTATPIALLPTGFEIHVPALAPSETLSLCFFVAWAAASSANEDATWFAVDLGEPALTRLVGIAA